MAKATTNAQDYQIGVKLAFDGMVTIKATSLEDALTIAKGMKNIEDFVDLKESGFELWDNKDPDVYSVFRV